MPTIADGQLTSMALCWRLERNDGAGVGLTSHDQAVRKDSVEYAPTPGVTPATVSRELGLDPHSAEVAGALAADALTDGDLALGRWSGARVNLSVVDWMDSAALPIDLLSGELGDVSIQGDAFSAELRGAAAKLEQPVCPSTSPECRAQFGDKRCRVDLAGRTAAAIVTGALDTAVTLDGSFGDTFVLGRLRYMSGANCGISTVILSASGTNVVVRDLPRAPVESGCKVELREGCDKRFATCVDRFANAVNFRGEPHLPGNDLLTRYPGA
jgi:uncharacterized phage protein (TIGR02218 family)